VAQEVCGKGVVVDGVEDAQRFAILFIVMSLLHVLLSPAKVGGPFLGTIRCYTSDILLCMAGFVQADSDGRGGGYVDIIDMGVKLGVLEHDFDESVVNVGVRNRRWAKKGRPRVEEDGELLVARHRNAAASNLWDADGDDDTRGACGDGAVFGGH
jgi:hypothetical protein